MNIEEILLSSFKERLDWDMEDIEVAESMIGVELDKKVKKAMNLESELDLDCSGFYDYHNLENKIWRELKIEFPDVAIPSESMENLMLLTPEDRNEYFKKKEDSSKNFKAKTIEMKIRLYQNTEEFLEKINI